VRSAALGLCLDGHRGRVGDGVWPDLEIEVGELPDLLAGFIRASDQSETLIALSL
jgi:hypothetical protein